MHEIHTVARENGKLKFVPVTDETSEMLMHCLNKLYSVGVIEKLVAGINSGKVIAFLGCFEGKPHFVLGRKT